MSSDGAPVPLRAVFHEELDQLRIKVELMGVRVDQNLERMRQVLDHGEEGGTFAAAVVADDEIDAMRLAHGPLLRPAQPRGAAWRATSATSCRSCASSPSSSGWATWRCASSSSAPTSRRAGRIGPGVGHRAHPRRHSRSTTITALRAWATRDLTLATELVEHRPGYHHPRAAPLGAAPARRARRREPRHGPVRRRPGRRCRRPRRRPRRRLRYLLTGEAGHLSRRSPVKRAPGGTLVGMKLLVTNDDGISSPGLHALVRALVQDGRDVVVAAPDRDMSGSQAIGRIHLDEHIDARHVELPGLAGVPTTPWTDRPACACWRPGWAASAGRPTWCCRASTPAATRAGPCSTRGPWGRRLRPPTSGAGARNRQPRRARPPGAGRARHWDNRGGGGGRGGLAGGGRPRCGAQPRVPDLPPERLAEAQAATLAPFGTVRSAVVETAEGGGRLQMELRPVNVELPPDCDTALVKGVRRRVGHRRHPGRPGRRRRPAERWCRTPGGRHEVASPRASGAPGAIGEEFWSRTAGGCVRAPW